MRERSRQCSQWCWGGKRGWSWYVADTYNHKIKAVDLTANHVRTFAGDGDAGLADGRPGRFAEPGGLSIAGNHLYVADTGNHAVRVIDRTTREVSTLRLRGLSPG